MTRYRFQPAIRRDLILKAALVISGRPGGWSRLTRQAIAQQADCSEALVSRYLGSMPAARKAIMKAAIKDQIVEIIGQSLVAHDGYAVKKWLPSGLKHKALIALLDK